MSVADPFTELRSQINPDQLWQSVAERVRARGITDEGVVRSIADKVRGRMFPDYKPQGSAFGVPDSTQIPDEYRDDSSGNATSAAGEAGLPGPDGKMVTPADPRYAALYEQHQYQNRPTSNGEGGFTPPDSLVGDAKMLYRAAANPGTARGIAAGAAGTLTGFNADVADILGTGAGLFGASEQSRNLHAGAQQLRQEAGQVVRDAQNPDAAHVGGMAPYVAQGLGAMALARGGNPNAASALAGGPFAVMGAGQGISAYRAAKGDQGNPLQEASLGVAYAAAQFAIGRMGIGTTGEVLNGVAHEMAGPILQGNAKALAGVILQTAKASGVQASEMGAMTLATNIIERVALNPNKDLSEGVDEAAASGALMGVGMSAGEAGLGAAHGVAARMAPRPEDGPLRVRNLAPEPMPGPGSGEPTAQTAQPPTVSEVVSRLNEKGITDPKVQERVVEHLRSSGKVAEDAGIQGDMGVYDGIQRDMPNSPEIPDSSKPLLNGQNQVTTTDAEGNRVSRPYSPSPFAASGKPRNVANFDWTPPEIPSEPDRHRPKNLPHAQPIGPDDRQAPQGPQEPLKMSTPLLKGTVLVDQQGNRLMVVDTKHPTTELANGQTVRKIKLAGDNGRTMIGTRKNLVDAGLWVYKPTDSAKQIVKPAVRDLAPAPQLGQHPPEKPEQQDNREKQDAESNAVAGVHEQKDTPGTRFKAAMPEATFSKVEADGRRYTKVVFPNGAGALVQAMKKPDHILISSVYVNKHLRHRGLATEAMKTMIAAADKESITLGLHPKSLGDGGPNDDQLRKWYGDMGFRAVDGKWMQRDPQKEHSSGVLDQGNSQGGVQKEDNTPRKEVSNGKGQEEGREEGLLKPETKPGAAQVAPGDVSPHEMTKEQWSAATRFYRSGKTKNAELPNGQRVILKKESTPKNFREVSGDFIESLRQNEIKRHAKSGESEPEKDDVPNPQYAKKIADRGAEMAKQAKAAPTEKLAALVARIGDVSSHTFDSLDRQRKEVAEAELEKRAAKPKPKSVKPPVRGEPMWKPGQVQVPITPDRHAFIERIQSATRAEQEAAMGDRADVFFQRRMGGAGVPEAVIKTLLWDTDNPMPIPGTKPAVDKGGTITQKDAADEQTAKPASERVGGNVSAPGEKPETIPVRKPKPDSRDGEEGGDSGSGAVLKPDRTGGGPAGREGNSDLGNAPEGERGRGRSDTAGGPGSEPGTSPVDDGITEQPKTPANSGNFIIEPEKLGQGSHKAKYRANIDAIKTLSLILSEGRPATRDEQQILSQYVGWGMFPQVFDYGNKEWAKEYKELEGLLTDDEWNAARRSTTNAHYTSAEIVSAMWDMAKRIGFRGGRVLEPSMGTGNFFGLLPAEMRNSKLTGVELDTTTGKIAQLLYPDANVNVMGFQDLKVPDNFYDFSIGNVPFGDYKVHDKQYNKFQANIHDYFFLKSLDKVRPGGVLMFITSTGTMDKVDSRIRRELASKADLIGAMRLPGGAFEKNAGTAVVTDIIILRKRGENDKPSGPDWQSITHVPDPAGGEAIPVNEYFANNPRQILGTLDRSGTMYRDDSKNVTLTDDFKDLFAAAVDRLPKDGYKKGEVSQKRNERAASDVSAKNGAFVSDGGKLYRRVNDALVEVESDKKTATLIADHMKVRDAMRAVFDSQLHDHGEDAKNQARTSLNKTYDDFVKKNGPLHSRANTNIFGSDPDHPVLLALEKYDPKTKKATKSDIFRKDTIRGYTKPGKAADAKEAVGISLNESGEIDVPRIAELLGISEDKAAKQLVSEGAAFLDPSAGFVPREVYLSGNVKAKLADAIAAAKVDDQYQANVDELQKVQPPDVPHDEIDVKLGASWVAEDDYENFAAHMLSASPGSFSFKQIPSTGEWMLNTTSPAAHGAAATEVWGTHRAPFMDVLWAAMNSQMIRINDKNSEGQSIFNAEESAAANSKVADVKQAFADWVWEDDERRTRLHRHYNDTFNNVRNIEYDGSFMTFPGMNPGIVLRPHQKNAVWLTISKGKALYAHEVGTGKTYTQIAAAMELRRLGLSRKPAIVVLKSTLEQFLEAARTLYPGAKILTTSDRFEAKQRKATISQIATGDWDMVILTHDNLDMLPMRAENVQRFIRDELAELEAVLQEVKANEKGGRKGGSRFVKQLEKAKERLETKLKEAIEGGKGQDDAVSFEETGIDFLFVDEAHKYKSLPVYSKQQRLKGIPTGRSDRATTMFMRSRWLMQQNKNRGVAFATGTPIANTVAELYTMMRYLQFDDLKSRGISAFDSWANLFTDQVTKMESKASGDYEATTRLAKFVNLPELNQIVRQIMDVRLAENMVGVVRPKRKDEVIAVDRGPGHAAFINDIRARASAVKTGRVDPREDNMLKISSDARKASLDLRLIDGSYEDYAGSKVNRAVEEILKIHKENPGKTQMVFSDIGVNKTDWGFSVFTDMKKKLVAGGIPAAKILLFTQEMTDTEKATAADKLKNGEALVGMGSTDKLGTGVNAQDHLLALHHLDVPWLPASVEQRDGRGWRQGNTNPTVHLKRYVTQDTFDTFMWGLVDTKSRFIKQFMRNEANARSVKDEDGEELSPAQIMAVASGDPRILEKVTLEDEVRTLDAASRRHGRDAMRLKDQLVLAKTKIVRAKEYIGELESDRETARTNKSEDGLSIIVMGKHYTDKEKAVEALLEAEKEVVEFGRREATIGEYRGFKISRSGQEWVARGKASYALPPKNTEAWIGSMNAQFSDSRFESRIEEAKANHKRYENDLKALESTQGKPFKDAAALTKKRERLKVLEAALAPKKDDPHAGPARGGYTTIFSDIVELGAKVAKAAAAAGIKAGKKLTDLVKESSKDAPERVQLAVLKMASKMLRGLHGVAEAQREAAIDRMAKTFADQVESPKTPEQREESKQEERSKGAARQEKRDAKTSKKELDRIVRESLREIRRSREKGIATARAELPTLIRNIRAAEKLIAGIEKRAAVDQAKQDAKSHLAHLDAFRTQAQQLAENLPMSLRGRYLTAVKDTKSLKGLGNVTNRVRRDLAVFEGRQAYKKIARVGTAQNAKLFDEAEKSKFRTLVAEAERLKVLLRSNKKTGYKVTAKLAREHAENLKIIRDTLVSMIHMEREKNSLVVRGRRERAEYVRSEMLDALGKAKSLDSKGEDPETSWIKRAAYHNSLHFTRLMKLLDGDWFGKGPFARMVKGLENAHRKHLGLKHEFTDRFSKIVTDNGYKSLAHFLAEADGALGPAMHQRLTATIGGKKLTLGEAMYIYALDPETRAQADEGVTFNFKAGKHQTAFGLHKGMRDQIARLLTPQQRAIVDQVKEMNDQMFWDKLDAVSKSLKGVHIEKVPKYWGIQRNRAKIEMEPESGWHGALQPALENSGILKDRVGGKLPILIGSFGTEAMSRADAAAKIATTAQALKNAYITILNLEVTGAIVNHHGRAMLRRIEETLKEFAVGQSEKTGPDWIRTLNSNASQAVVQANPRSMLRNLGSVFTMAHAIGFRGVAGSLPAMFDRNIWRELLKRSPILRERFSHGAYTLQSEMEHLPDEIAGLGRSEAMKLTLKQLGRALFEAVKGNRAQAGKELSGANRAWRQFKATLNWSHWFDGASAMIAYAHFKKKTEAAHPDWTVDRVANYATRRAEDAFQATANTSDVLHSDKFAQNARKNSVVAAFQSFMSDASQKRNMLIEAFGQGKKKAVRTMAALALAMAWSTAVTGGVGYGIAKAGQAIGGNSTAKNDAAAVTKSAHNAAWTAAQEIGGLIPGGAHIASWAREAARSPGGATVMDSPVTSLVDSGARVGYEIVKAAQAPKFKTGTTLTAGERALRAVDRAFQTAQQATGSPTLPIYQILRQMYLESKK